MGANGECDKVDHDARTALCLQPAEGARLHAVCIRCMLRPVLSLLTCSVPTVAAHQKQICNMEILLSVLEVVSYEDVQKHAV